MPLFGEALAPWLPWLLSKTIYPITYIHTGRQGCVAALELHCLVWVWRVLNWFQRSVGIDTAGALQNSKGRLWCLHSLWQVSFPFLSFPHLRFDLWALILASREDWHTPDPVHLAAMSESAHSGSPGVVCMQWVSHFLLHWSRKPALRWMEESFKFCHGGQKLCVILQATLKMFLEDLMGY